MVVKSARGDAGVDDISRIVSGLGCDLSNLPVWITQCQVSGLHLSLSGSPRWLLLEQISLLATFRPSWLRRVSLSLLTLWLTLFHFCLDVCHSNHPPPTLASQPRPWRYATSKRVLQLNLHVTTSSETPLF